jgi:Ca-activated chloride channel family protein
MKRNLTLLALIFLSAVASFAADSTFLVRKRVSEVQFTLVATDQHNRPVLNLSPSDITILDNGQPISSFGLRSAADLPLRIGVVLDLSDSNTKSWATIKTAVARSLQDVMGPGDELLILSFNSKIELERTISDPAQLEGLLTNLPAGGLTALYDTLYHACDNPLFVNNREPHRSALMVFSDGEDDLSLRGLNDAIARAQLRGVSIYTVASHNPKKSSAGDAVLRSLATATGGRDYVVKNADQLRGALSAINDELRNSYLLYYRVPEETGSRTFRQVHVLSTQRDGAHIRARAGYFTAP